MKFKYSDRVIVVNNEFYAGIQGKVIDYRGAKRITFPDPWRTCYSYITKYKVLIDSGEYRYFEEEHLEFDK